MTPSQSRRIRRKRPLAEPPEWTTDRVLQGKLGNCQNRRIQNSDSGGQQIAESVGLVRTTYHPRRDKLTRLDPRICRNVSVFCNEDIYRRNYQRGVRISNYESGWGAI